MMNFRGHILKAVISTDSYEDPATGQIVPGTETVVEFPCRVSPNGKGVERRGQDGMMVVFGSLVHANKSVPLLPFGTIATVYENGIEKAKGKVIDAFSNGMNMRIWI